MPDDGLIALYNHIKDPDRAKREQMLALIQQNPNLIQQLSNNVQSAGQLQTLIGQAPRWGGNQDQQRLSDLVMNTSQDSAHKLDSLENFQNTGIDQVSNASVTSPQGMAAFRGMTGQQVADTVANANSNAKDGKPQYLSQDQLDQKAKKDGLQTSYEKVKADLDNQETAARINASKSNSAYQDTLTAGAPDEARLRQQKLAQNQIGLDADTVMEGHFAQNPKLRAKPILDIFNDPNTSQQVKSAIINSNKYGDVFKTQLTQSVEKQRLALEKERINNEKQAREEWFPKLIQANAIESVMKYGGGTIEGFKDLYSGNNSPAAQGARDALNGATPAQKIQTLNEFNTRVSDITKQDSAGKLKPEDAQTLIQGINLQAKRLQAMGIPAKELTYAESKKKGLGQALEDKLNPFSQPHRSIQTIDGGTPGNTKYDPKNDSNKILQDQTDSTVNVLAKGIQDGSVDVNAIMNHPQISGLVKSRLKLKLATPDIKK